MKVILVIILLCVVNFCGRVNAYEFKVLLQDVPSRISLKDANLNHVLYIIRQLFEPIFYYGTNGFSSNILSKWSANRDFTSYTLCLKDDLYFSNGKKVTINDIGDNISYFKKNRYFKVPLRDYNFIEQNCIKLNFEQSYMYFVDDFSEYQLSIIDVSTLNNDINIGISPYSITEVVKGDRIVLEIAKHAKSKPFIDKIVISKYKKGLNLEDYEEINYIDPSFISEELKQTFVTYKTLIIKAYYLLVNHENEDVRKIISCCVNKESLFNKFLPAYNEYNLLNSFVPRGLSDITFKDSLDGCDVKKTDKLVKVKFLSFVNDPARNNGIRDYLNGLLNKYNIKVEVVSVSLQELATILESKEKKYDMTIIGVGGGKIVYYFKPFGLGDNDERYINFSFSNRRQYLKQINFAKTQREKDTIIEKLSKVLKEEYYVIPLVQIRKTYYYPHDILIPYTESFFDFSEYKIKDIKKR